MSKILIHKITSDHKQMVISLLNKHWGDTRVVSRGKLHNAAGLPGFIAMIDGEVVGMVTYRVEKHRCELVTLNSEKPGLGIGTVLIKKVRDVAVNEDCSVLWLITTNDNIEAIRFYQKRGFELKAIHLNAIEHSRVLKPSIPLTGDHGIGIQHEIEFTMNLQPE